MAFDNTNGTATGNTNGTATGVSLCNATNQAANVPVIVRDDTGAMIGTGAISLAANGQTSFVLTDPQIGYPVTANKRGTIEFETPVGGQISAADIHVALSGAFTSIPVLTRAASTATAAMITTNIISGVRHRRLSLCRS